MTVGVEVTYSHRRRPGVDLGHSGGIRETTSTISQENSNPWVIIASQHNVELAILTKIPHGDGGRIIAGHERYPRGECASSVAQVNRCSASTGDRQIQVAVGI